MPRSEFPELKSQKELDQDNSWNAMKWYIYFSFGISFVISVLMAVALIKYIFS